MIRFIVDTKVSKRDVYGNCYTFSTVTSVQTGKTLSIRGGYGSNGGNVKAMLRRAGADWSEIHASESVLPIRQFNRAEKALTDTLWEHEVSEETILGLEQAVSAEC